MTDFLCFAFRSDFEDFMIVHDKDSPPPPKKKPPRPWLRALILFGLIFLYALYELFSK